MCDDCGCGEANARKDGHGHSHKDGHHHRHSHDGEGHSHTRTLPDGAVETYFHNHDARDGKAEPHKQGRIVQVERSVMARNDEAAAANRLWLKNRGVVAANLISSPGTGKTLLLERTLERLDGKLPCAVIAGDQRTDNDARRLMGKGAEVVQIETRDACHLDAARIAKVLPEVVKKDVRLLFIENVGNLVCPAAFDLGESFKIALLSTTEGEDKPLKYPTVFNAARIVVLTKTDLAPHLDWDAEACRRNIRQVNPGVFVFELSAKTGDGMDAWIEYLLRL